MARPASEPHPQIGKLVQNDEQFMQDGNAEVLLVKTDNENSVREVHKIVIFKKRIIIKMNVIKGKKLFF